MRAAGSLPHNRHKAASSAVIRPIRFHTTSLSKVRRAAKVQSSVEYLIVYGWLIVLLSLVFTLLLYFASAPQNVAPNSCSLIQAAAKVACEDIVISANAVSHNTVATLYLFNAEPYAVANVMALMAIGGSNTTPSSCYPALVRQGAPINCVIQVPGSYKDSQYVAGAIYVRFSACGLLRNYSISSPTCTNAPTATSVGAFQAHVQGTPAPTSTTVASTTVLTSSTSTSITTTTTSTISLGPHQGVIIFGVQGALTGVPAGTNILTLDGTNYGYGSLPVYTVVTIGNTVTYSWNGVVLFSPTSRWEWSSTSGCGATAQSGSFVAQSSCEANGVYGEQYYLTTATSPGSGGSVSSPGWFNANTNNVIQAYPNSGYEFAGWSGSVAQGDTGIAYSGMSNPYTITVNGNGITETADFKALTPDIWYVDNSSDKVVPVNSSYMYIFSPINVGPGATQITASTDDSTVFVSEYGAYTSGSTFPLPSPGVAVISTSSMSEITNIGGIGWCTGTNPRTCDEYVHGIAYNHCTNGCLPAYQGDLVATNQSGSDDSIMSFTYQSPYGYKNSLAICPSGQLIGCPTNPYDLAFSEDGSVIGVTDRISPGQVSFIAASTGSALKAVVLPNGASQGEMPSGIAFDALGFAYVAVWESGDLAVISPSPSYTVTEYALNKAPSPNFDTNIHPEGVAVYDAGQELFVADTKSNVVEVFRIPGGVPTWLANISVPSPRYIAITKNGFAFVTSSTSGLYKISIASLSVVSSYPDATGIPDGITVLP